MKIQRKGFVNLLKTTAGKQGNWKILQFHAPTFCESNHRISMIPMSYDSDHNSLCSKYLVTVPS